MEHVETTGGDSMNEVIRTILQDKIKIDNLLVALPSTKAVQIPSYVAKNKYVIFVNEAIVGIGDNPSELAEIAMRKFPNFPFVMKYNGIQLAPLEYLFTSMTV